MAFKQTLKDIYLVHMKKKQQEENFVNNLSELGRGLLSDFVHSLLGY